MSRARTMCAVALAAGSSEEIWGTDFADVLAGGAGDQTLAALGGDDRVRGGAGSDAFRCGAGIDRATLDLSDVLRGPDLTDGTREILEVQP